jgi:phosphoadenosine phosphosulfate reductase
MQESYRDMVLAAMARPLAEKVARAIAFLRGNEALAGEQGYYLAFSGGKDSVVMLRLAQMAGVRYDAHYNQTTIDPPELIAFIREHHADVEWNIPPEGNLIMHMVNKSKGPPTRIARWCCEIYKERGGKGRAKLIGVRAAESPRRMEQWREITPHRTAGTIICPILYWTDDDIWDFIRDERIPYCRLYDEGFDRLGCIGCPMSGPKGMARDFARWPGFERLWKIGFRRWWARWKGVPRRDGKPRYCENFSSWMELWEWWISRKRREEPTGCQGSLAFSGGEDNEGDEQA